MRLHTLSVTAFGPFAGTVSVDFDDLSDSGLFLLTGPTGAGKSSVLDAVCFALYGQVPGDRQSARQLRCDRAAASVAPEVVLEASIRGRRFRFTRSPQWERAKKRGSGTTRVQAHVVVEELRPDGWAGLTNRLDDAGLLVTDLLGMTCGQFTQVAMLPQGRFMTFLRAKSEERQRVLQALFRTDRFEQVERWLVDRRIALRRQGQAANDRVAGVLNRLQEAAGVPVPETWELADLALPATAGEVTAWADRVRADVESATRAAAVRRAEAATRADEATAALRLAEERTVRQQRGRAAQAVQAALAETAGQADDDTEALARHERAQPVARLAVGADRAAREAERASLRAREALAEAAQVIDSSLDLVAAEEHATAVLAVAEAFRPRHAELERLGLRCAELADQRLALAREAEGLQQELAALPDQVAGAAEQLERARQAAAGVAPAQVRHHDALRALEAGQELATVVGALAAAEAEALAARDSAQQLREHWLDVREARIHGMAAELATGLAVGCACPVCGSAEHPMPAGATTGAVGRAEEEAARKAHEQAEFAHQLVAEKVTELRARRAGLEERSGGLDVPSARALVHEAAQALDALQAQAAQVAGHQARLETLRAAHATATQRGQALEKQLEGIRVSHQAASEQAEQLTAELAELLAGTAAETLDELVGQQEQARAVLVRARTARHAEEVAAGAAEAAGAAVLEAAGQAGFDSVDEAIAAALSDEAATRLRQALEQRRREHDRAATVLTDDEVRAALAQPEPDLPGLRTLAATAQVDRDQAVVLDEATARRARRLDALAADLQEALDAWAPVREQHALVAGLAALVEGKGPDNPQRIRLSAYVLGERLRQVVAAANERLTRMSGSRYVLEQSDDRSAGDQRGGLSLRVLDAWSGVARDPATLSGGETFIVSLALALGLADTVCHEAGGTDIDTLFIDEGFGSLDSDTLDDVMDTLDGLREGGRVVGLVSHVPELRTRIPTQLEVTKTREGSGLRALVSTG